MRVQASRLSNGIRVESELVPGVRSVAVGVWVRRGGAHDPPGQEGAAHMLEHMTFKGTERRSAKDVALSLEPLGGWLDAYTSREHTCYQARLSGTHLQEALDVLADIVMCPRLDPADLEVERKVVLEEIAQVEDTPDDLVYEIHGNRLWSGHPYGKPILGTEESVRALSVDALREVHASHIGENIIVAAAGSVDHEQLVDHTEALFGMVPADERNPPLGRPRDTRRGEEWRSRPGKQAHVVFGAAVPGRTDPDRHPLAVISQALGGGMSSRLFQRVREELGLCYHIHTYQAFFRAAGITGVYVGARPGTAERAVKAICREMSSVADGELNADEISSAKEQLKGSLVLSLESTASRLARLASFALNDEPFLGLDQLLERIDRVDSDDIARVAETYFRPENHLVVRLGPDPTDVAVAQV